MCLLKDELRITRLDDNISYIEPTVNPLSANVVIINGKDAVWLYDVGSHPDIPDMLYDYITKSKVTVDDEVSLRKKKINIVLSHFHPDHTGNLMKICDKAGGCEVYQGRLWWKRIYMLIMADCHFIYFHCLQATQKEVWHWRLIINTAFLVMEYMLCRRAVSSFTMQDC